MSFAFFAGRHGGGHERLADELRCFPLRSLFESANAEAVTINTKVTITEKLASITKPDLGFLTRFIPLSIINSFNLIYSPEIRDIPATNIS